MYAETINFEKIEEKKFEQLQKTLFLTYGYFLVNNGEIYLLEKDGMELEETVRFTRVLLKYMNIKILNK